MKKEIEITFLKEAEVYFHKLPQKMKDKFVYSFTKTPRKEIRKAESINKDTFNKRKNDENNIFRKISRKELRQTWKC